MSTGTYDATVTGIRGHSKDGTSITEHARAVVGADGHFFAALELAAEVAERVHGARRIIAEAGMAS